MKNKEVKTKQLLNRNFSPGKYETKAIKNSELCFLLVDKFNILLACLLPATHPIVYAKRIGGGI